MTRLTHKIRRFFAPLRTPDPMRSNAVDPPTLQWMILFPTLLTLGNMTLGFFALSKTVNHTYSLAAMAILAGTIPDLFDGFVARRTKTCSRFGAYLDSLADGITCCIAPAFMMYELFLKHNGIWGLSIALVFVGCGTIRLVRFTLKALLDSGGENHHFAGLPVPAAGGSLAIVGFIFDSIGKEYSLLSSIDENYFCRFVCAYTFSFMSHAFKSQLFQLQANASVASAYTDFLIASDSNASINVYISSHRHLCFFCIFTLYRW
jgi:CDP-diacylglycerol--serine O-phosphatidyltransferase